jgi:hypothetical protein
MKTLLILCALTCTLHAAEPPPSFVWQGKTISLSHLVKVDETRVRLADGTMIPISAVPPLLRSRLGPVPPAGSLLTGIRVVQILKDGLLMMPQNTDTPIFLRLPEAPDRKNGIQPDQTMTCYAVSDGLYTYITRDGAEKTINAWLWTGRPAR